VKISQILLMFLGGVAVQAAKNMVLTRLIKIILKN
jgi:hypothetical protein